MRVVCYKVEIDFKIKGQDATAVVVAGDLCMYVHTITITAEIDRAVESYYITAFCIHQCFDCGKEFVENFRSVEITVGVVLRVQIGYIAVEVTRFAADGKFTAVYLNIAERYGFVRDVEPHRDANARPSVNALPSCL